MRLLLIGGAGHLGGIVRPALEAEHTCRYLDLKPVPGAEDRTIVADVNDDEALQRAVEDIDVVVYMALGAGEPVPVGPKRAPSKHSDPDIAMRVNVLGVYRALRHGLEAGVRRFVHASSLSVYASDGRPFPIREDMPMNAWATYGLSKRLAEEVCRAAVDRYPDASILALRLMRPLSEPMWNERHGRRVGKHPLGPRDAQRLYLAAVRFDRPGFHVVQASGDVAGEHIPHDRAAELIGWTPRGE
ncbi:MAG: NAD-dependent epimerase/dehydratase family protein [Phycisphaeraceae bacterium]